MIRLNSPSYSFEQILNECSSGIAGNNTLRQRIEEGKPSLLSEGDRYIAVAKIGELYTINCIDNGQCQGDQLIVDNLKKLDLIKIYTKYFVPEKKPARKIYDTLLLSARDECPYCGGIGVPRNLDHYLPKAHFPQYSVFPYNLVPACRDCNYDGKSNAFAIRPGDQIIQPYLDNDQFFLEQWVFANYHSGSTNESGYFEYYVNPPEKWCVIDKERVRKHFDCFDLSRRYAIHAAKELSNALRQIMRLEPTGPGNEEINNMLHIEIEAIPFVNHWRRIMYQALMKEFEIELE